MASRGVLRQRTRGRNGDTDQSTGDQHQTLGRSESGLELSVTSSIAAIDGDRWNALVERSAGAGVFHRYEWLAAVEAGIGYPVAHLLVEKDGNLVGCCPNVVVDIEPTPFRRLTSVYPGFGGPLLPTDTAEALDLVLEAIPSLCGGRTVVHEIRASDMEYLKYHERLRESRYRSLRMGCRLLVDLERQYADVLEAMSSSRRRGIEDAASAGVTIVEDPVTRSTLRRFADTYGQVMDRVGGSGFPVEFFERLVDLESRMLLLSAWVGEEYAGGMLELRNDEQNTIHGLFAAVPAEYFDAHVSELLYDYVIRWGIDHGYETYDLGDTGADFRNGVFRFKRGFGASVVPNLFWERGTSPLAPIFRAGRSLYWRRSSSVG